MQEVELFWPVVATAMRFSSNGGPCSHSGGRRSHLLINRSSTCLYSGMVPGLIAGLYQREELAIDLRQLCDQAGVAFVEAEITGLVPEQNCLNLRNRPPTTSIG